MIILLPAFAPVANIQAGPSVWLSPSGKDDNLGTKASPLRTLQAAVERARTKKLKEILLEPGEYRQTQSVKLGPLDSGLTIRSASGERALISGSVTIPREAIRICTDNSVLGKIIDPSARRLVREVDLSALGIDSLTPIYARGFPHNGAEVTNELFAGQSPLILARWPNKGFAKVGRLTNGAGGDSTSHPSFVAGERPKLWSNALDAWAYGYWKNDWADESIKIRQVSPETGAVTLSNPHTYGISEGVPFFVENLIEELDSPGEYFLDRSTRRLYFIPLGTGSQRLRLLVSGQPLIEVTNAQNITLKGLDFAYSRGDGVHLTNCIKSVVSGSKLYDLGSKAVVISGGRRSGVQSCDIWNTGSGGVILEAGNRRDLQAGNAFVDNCDIREYQRLSQTYTPGVFVKGCGNRVSHSAIHDAPHSAILLEGNNHLIEANNLYRTLTRTGDGGVIYLGRDWTERGTVIRDNSIHDNWGLKTAESAIYLDDQACGITVTGNSISRDHWALLIGGGRDNVVMNNTILDCDGGIKGDARGLGWAKSSYAELKKAFQTMPVQSDAWKKAYPQLTNMLAKNPMAPKDNLIENNLMVKSGKLEDLMEPAFKLGARISGNKVAFNLSSPNVKSQAGALGFKNAGLYPDALRSLLHD